MFCKNLQKVLVVAFFSFTSYTYCQENSSEQLIELGDVALKTDYFRAIKYYQNALDLSLVANDSTQLAIANMKLGYATGKIRKDVVSLDYYKKALEISAVLKDSLLIGTIHNYTGFTMYDFRDNNAAMTHFSKASKIFGKTPKDTLNLARAYLGVAIVYNRSSNKKTREKAYPFEKVIRKVFEKHNKEEELAKLNLLYGSMMSYKKNYKETKKYYLKSLNYYKSIGSDDGLIESYGSLGHVSNKTKDFSKALKYYDSCLFLAEKMRHKTALHLTYNYKYRVYEEMKQYKPSLDAYKLYKRYADSMYSILRERDLQRKITEVNFFNEKLLDSIKSKEIQTNLKLIASKEEFKKITYSSTLILLLITVLIIYILIRNKKKRIELDLKNQNLENHFIKNRLKEINTEAQRIATEKKLSIDNEKAVLEALKMLKKNNSLDMTKSHLNSIIYDLQRRILMLKKTDVLDDNIDKRSESYEKKLIEKHPELTKSEREMCKLIRLGLSIKDIVVMKNVSSSSVRVMRHRIRVKLGLEKGDELAQFLKSIL